MLSLPTSPEHCSLPQGNHHSFITMSDITVSAAVLGVASLCSISAVRTLALQLKHREPRSAWYEDADGKSTPEAVAAFSTSIPKMIVLFLATTGCALSIAVSVLETLFVDRSLTFLVNWLTTTSWVCTIVCTTKCFAVYSDLVTEPHRTSSSLHLGQS